MENTSLVLFNDASLGDMFSSFNPKDMELKVKLYNAINSPDKKLGDCINQEITMRDVVVSVVQLNAKNDDDDHSGRGSRMKPPAAWEDENTEYGKKTTSYRVVIIDKDGVSYTATSNGIYNSINHMRNIFGTLHFDEGLRVKVNQIQTKNGKTLTLSIVA